MNNDKVVIEFPSLQQNTAWDPPILFSSLETPEIYAYWLPGIFGEFAAAISNMTETPEALSVMTVLGVISAAITKQFMICPIAGWHEPVNIYTLIALPPANHKSLVLNHCIKPMIDWEKERTAQLSWEIKRQSSERKTQEKIIEGLRARAAKAKNVAEQNQLINAITSKEASLTNVIVAPVLFTNDATPESLASLVHEQGGRLAIFSDEGGILETLSGLYSYGAANIDILLKGIDGGEVRVRRKDRSMSLNPYLTIALTVQPTVIQNMSEKRVYLGNGALERFLYVLPKSNLGYRTHDKPTISASLCGAYHGKITSLLNEFSLMEENKPIAARLLTLSPTAYQAWRNFQAIIEIQLKPDGKLVNCQGWGGKICGFALRIAGLLHVAEHGVENLVIAENTMANALAISSALTEHAIAAFRLMEIDQATEDAKTVFHWIKAMGKKLFTLSELVLAMRNKKLGKSARLVKVLQVLHERNIISAPVKVATRKPTIVHYVNPMISG